MSLGRRRRPGRRRRGPGEAAWEWLGERLDRAMDWAQGRRGRAVYDRW